METETDVEAPDVLDLLNLPASDALDAILAEQQAFDRMVADSEFGEIASGELGKTRLESRAEIPSLALLHHQRRVLVRALAPLSVLFEGKGQGSPADARRKQHRHMIATLIATEQGLDGDKLESKLERLANSDPRHVAFCGKLDDLRLRYYEGRNALIETMELIRDREESLRAYNAEVKAGLAGAGQV